MEIELPSTPEVEAEIELNLSDDGFFLKPRLDVAVPGVSREVAQSVVDAAHGICPYSKAVRGNLDVTTRVV